MISETLLYLENNPETYIMFKYEEFIDCVIACWLIALIAVFLMECFCRIIDWFFSIIKQRRNHSTKDKDNKDLA